MKTSYLIASINGINCGIVEKLLLELLCKDEKHYLDMFRFNDWLLELSKNAKFSDLFEDAEIYLSDKPSNSYLDGDLKQVDDENFKLEINGDNYGLIIEFEEVTMLTF